MFLLALTLWIAPVGPVCPAQTSVAAHAGEQELSFDELDRVLVNRKAMSEEGRGTLQYLIQTEVLRHLAEERGVEVTAVELNGRWSELDQALRSSGVEGGLLEEIRSQRITPEQFRELLALSIVHERLTRQALGLGPDVEVSGDQQTIWIEQEIAELGFATPPPPWPEGICASSGDIRIAADDYAEMLRRQLAVEDIREICLQMLLVKHMRAAMPDLSPEAREAAVQAEIERRRTSADANPAYKGVGYDELLRAQGVVVSSLPEDPSIVAAALATLWVDRTHGEAGLRRTYEDEQTYFEDRYGEALDTRLLFLGAARRTNELQQRSFEVAHGLLEKWAGEIENEVDFATFAGERSDDPYTKRMGGELGWVTRGDPAVPENLREALFAHLDAHELPASGALVGPFDLENGVGLAWISGRRPSPPWEEMKQHVHRELRGRFATDLLAPASLITYLDETP